MRRATRTAGVMMATVLGLVFFEGATSRVEAQGSASSHFQIRVLAEGEDADLFQSVAAAAFRRLGDVDVVTDLQFTDFVFFVGTLCSERSATGECRRYATRLDLLSTPRSDQLTRPLVLGYQDLTDAPERAAENADLLSQYLRLLGFLRAESTVQALWSRDSYRTDLEDHISSLDSRCLEYRRREAALSSRSDEGMTASAREQLRSSGDWICNN